MGNDEEIGQSVFDGFKNTASLWSSMGNCRGSLLRRPSLFRILQGRESIEIPRPGAILGRYTEGMPLESS